MLTEILLLVLCVALVWWYIAIEWTKPRKFPPGPQWIPFIGNGPELRKLAKKVGGQHLAYIELAKTFDSDVVGLKIGKEKVICVCSYPTVRQVMTTDEYVGRPDNFFFRLRTMGVRKGITGPDGELWKEQRTFLVTHLRALGFGKSAMEEMIKEEIRDHIAQIETNVGGVDLSETLAPLVLNILWFLTSGRGLKGNHRIERLLQLLKKRTAAFDMTGGVLNNYPWLRYIAPKKTGYTLLQKINREIYDFIMEAVNDHREKWTEGRNDDVIYSFFTEMKRLEGQPNYFTEDQLVMICLDIFIAGSTTTSNTIEFAFLAMILYPDVQGKVLHCLDSTFKKDEEIYYSDRQRVPYIEAVLLECQRFFPVLPVSGPRRVLTTTHLDEYIIPKDTTVFINLHSVHHDKDYWKDPENFRPERFLDSDGNLINQDRVLTFGLGKRRCLGDALARACIFLFFVEILRKYRITYHEYSRKPTGKQLPGISMSPEKYRAKFIPRM